MTTISPEPCSASLQAALASMDVLNRWVRSTGCMRPRKAVYWLKSRYAIRDAIMAGLTTRMRYVVANVKCNRCLDGVYIDWQGDPRGQCYHCNGRGQAALKFVETTIADKWTWHSPVEYASWLGWPMNDLTPEPVTDWQPGREGVDLRIEEAVRHLNVVEGHWTQWLTEKPYENSYDEWDSTRYYRFNYALRLPFDEEGGCALCGASSPTEHCCVTCPPGLEISRPVCKPCADTKGVWDALKSIPISDIGPELELWKERHTAAFIDLWSARYPHWAQEWQLNRRRQNAELKHRRESGVN